MNNSVVRRPVRSGDATLHLDFHPGETTTKYRLWVSSGLGASYRRSDLLHCALGISRGDLTGLPTGAALRLLLNATEPLVALPESSGPPSSRRPAGDLGQASHSDEDHNGHCPGQAQLSLDLPDYNQKRAAKTPGDGTSEASSPGFISRGE